MKIAITGASGHVGANLTRLLIKQGHDLKVLYYKDNTAFSNLAVESIKGDILDTNSINKLIAGSEYVIHLAAFISITGDKNGKVFNINTQGTQNICEACIKYNIKRLIHFSSIHSFKAEPFDAILDETRESVGRKALAYDISKAKAESIVKEYVKKGLNAVILNPTSIIGPYDFKPSLMGSVLLKLFKGQLPALVSGGYDFVDVRDVAMAALLAIEKGRNGENYLLSGTWKKISELAAIAENISGVSAPRFTCPHWLAIISLPFLNLHARAKSSQPLYTKESLDVLRKAHRNISSQKATTELGFQSRPLEETIKDTLDWFTQNKY